jgi:hypothetical protein
MHGSHYGFVFVSAIPIMRANMVTQLKAMEGESSETVIVAKATEEVTIKEMATAMCKVGSVLISKMYFMPAQDGEGSKNQKS